MPQLSDGRDHFRDWSGDCEHVNRDVYTPIVHELLNRLPVRPGQAAPTVLVPGAGLCRLAWDLASAGFNVEASDDSSQLLPRIKVTSRSSASEASALTL